MEIEVKRFDKVFFETDPKNLGNKRVSFLFSYGNEDAVWLEKIKTRCGGNYTLRYKKIHEF
jgi:hypothetical protein